MTASELQQRIVELSKQFWTVPAASEEEKEVFTEWQCAVQELKDLEELVKCSRVETNEVTH